MRLSFTKMHGLGNDFMVIDAITQTVELTPEQIRRWADRHFGVGFDQLLLVAPPTLPDTLFTYRIFNADGSEVEQCGNGARCFARFVRDKGLTQEHTIPVGTKAGRIVLEVTDAGEITVNMGCPRFQPEQIPFLADTPAKAYPLELPTGQTVMIDAVSMGNPHAVLDVPSVDWAPVAEMGAQIEIHPRFPQRVNVGFMEVVDRQQIRLRVFERGAGETLACGTGASAAVVSGIRRGLLDSPCRVLVRGGELSIAWAGTADAPVMMTGPAEPVFEGQLTSAD
ncbi:diaminopimelate epimerase [Halothiobacillus sp. DCM-1]|uniref:diaminopimelate epimerase n=1 Tax=Halothiobacillus sp. DCM-1 TaxID=3112558 RepID=UPI00324A0EB7